MSAGGGTGEPDDLWETHAGWWQDGFTEGADPEYEEQILPLAAEHLAGARTVLDVGTGEGQVARLALAGGAERVLGVDPTLAQVVEAARRGGGPSYARAGADRLPVASGSIDAVVACLVFEHIEAVDDAIAEVARVLAPGGRFLFFLNHPLLQTPKPAARRRASRMAPSACLRAAPCIWRPPRPGSYRRTLSGGRPGRPRSTRLSPAPAPWRRMRIGAAWPWPSSPDPADVCTFHQHPLRRVFLFGGKAWQNQP